MGCDLMDYASRNARRENLARRDTVLRALNQQIYAIRSSPACGDPQKLKSMSTITTYGYEGLFVILFLEAIGIPIPGALALLIAGAACASGNMRLSLVLPISVGAMLAGDTLLYMVGRKPAGICWAFSAAYRQIQKPASCARQNPFTGAVALP